MLKVEVFVPQSHLDPVLEALHGAGAGRIGLYDHCFSVSPARGCWRPLEGAHPWQGEPGRIQWADEVKVETTCPEGIWPALAAAVRSVHPYEEPVIRAIALLEEGRK